MLGVFKTDKVMKKIITILFVLIITKTASWGQTNAICTYQVYSNKDSVLGVKSNDDVVEQDTKNMLNFALDIAKNFEYVLKFNTSESIFQLDDLLINDSHQDNYLYPVALAIVGRGKYYMNKNYSMHQVETSGMLFLIKDSENGKGWTITHEEKKIGKYTCFKAFKECEKCRSAVEVWFTPEIPAPFGPLGLGGLPGLIVEVKKRLFTLRLSAISYPKNRIIIKEPQKGKLVSKEEYKEISLGFRKNIKKL